MNQETIENFMASVVDVSSIFFAYTIGIHQFNPGIGLGYAVFDAWIVIWQRKRITRMVQHVLGRFYNREVESGRSLTDLNVVDSRLRSVQQKKATIASAS